MKENPKEGQRGMKYTTDTKNPMIAISIVELGNAANIFFFLAILTSFYLFREFSFL